MRIKEIAKKSLGGGLSGATAMVLQVLCLMWLRTTVNVEMATGASFFAAFHLLYSDGGIFRFYRGLGPALIQGPLSRFGDTAANAGMLALLERSTLPMVIKTFFASCAAALWRMIIMPIDTVKILMQLTGGTEAIEQRWQDRGILGFYSGAIGAAVATLCGHFPWFFVNNALEARLPRFHKTARRALIALCAAVVSDCVSNSLRVLKTVAQTNAVDVGYAGALKLVLKQDGVSGLLFRGLATKILSNCISSVLFSILWKMLMDFSNSPQPDTKRGGK